MAELDNFPGHTDATLLTGAQATKELTSDKLDNLLSNKMMHPDVLDVTAGGTFDLTTPQADLDLYLGTATLRIIGTPAAGFNITIPDGDHKTTWVNETGQLATIDTVTTAAVALAVPGASTKTAQVRGTDFTVVSDDSGATGALLADGSIPATGDFTFVDKELARVSLKDYSEEQASAASVGGTVTLDIENGNVYKVTLTEDTTFVFDKPSPDGFACSFTLFLFQDAVGGWVTTWPAEVKWEIGSPPGLSVGANDEDIIAFATIDEGTEWFGFTGGLNFG